MRYEHERWIKHLIELRLITEGYNPNEETKAVEELEEVYAKAKAWQTLKEELLTDYPFLVRVWVSTNGEGEHAEMCKANEILERMDELDGTHEFSNLLDDMNREDK